LLAKGYDDVSARIVGNARLRRQDCIATTMVDYCALPQEAVRAWPGRAEAARVDSGRKAACVEDALLNDLTAAMGARFNPRRFVPFVVMHEFEGLLFSDCAAFAAALAAPTSSPSSKKYATSLQRRKKSTIRPSQRPPNG
jgi:hypothetical protein